MQWRINNKLTITPKNIIFTVLGALCGFLYAHYVGCITGTCPITSNRFVATVFFSFFGYILSIESKSKKEEKNDTNK
jgi:hypothetical protein